MQLLFHCVRLTNPAHGICMARDPGIGSTGYIWFYSSFPLNKSQGRIFYERWIIQSMLRSRIHLLPSLKLQKLHKKPDSTRRTSHSWLDVVKQIKGFFLPWRGIDLINVLLQSFVPIPFVPADFAVVMPVVLKRHRVECSPLSPANLPSEVAMFLPPKPEWIDGKTKVAKIHSRGE